MTETSLLPSALRPAWYTPVSGRISSQALVAENVPAAGQRTLYVGTSKGVVYALGENGYIRWRVELGQLDRICQQIDGYGVTGTGVIDPATHALYLVDGFGRLHALDLVTGAERAGWPVQLYTDHRKELVWGAMTLVNGSIYVGTGSLLRPADGRQGLPDRAGDEAGHAVGVGAAAARRRRQRVGVGRRHLQPEARLALRGDRERVSRRHERRQALQGVGGLRRAHRRAVPRPRRARRAPSAADARAGHRLLRLADPIYPSCLRRSGRGDQQGRLHLRLAGDERDCRDALQAAALQPDEPCAAALAAGVLAANRCRSTWPRPAGSSVSTLRDAAAGA